MIRTLGLIAFISFFFSVICFASAFAIAGGPFSLHFDRHGHFHAPYWGDEDDDGDDVSLRVGKRADCALIRDHKAVRSCERAFDQGLRL